MKNLIFLSVLAAFLMFSACNVENSSTTGLNEIIGKPELKLTSDRMTPEVLWAFGRVSDPQVSPDGSKVLYGISYYSIEKNKGNRDLYVVNIDGTGLRQITKTAVGEYNAVWSPNGQKIGFLSCESGSMQIWEMNPDGTNRKQISNIENGVTGFKYSPDQKKILFTKEVAIEKTLNELYEGLPLATGQIYNDLFYRHWDVWVDSYSHVFVADYTDGKVENEKDIMEGEPWDTPLKPFGGMEQINWSPDGKTIAYTCRKLKGKEATLSTNSDIFLYNTETGKTENISSGMMGFDVAPVYSPDGTMLAWESMERDGYESDQVRLFVHDFTTGKNIYYTEGFDQDAHGLAWSADNKTIYFISDWHAIDDIYSLNIETGKIANITKGEDRFTSVIPAGKTLVATRNSMAFPTEIFTVNAENGNYSQITFTNAELLSKITMGKAEKRWIKTTDNKQMLTWVIYPPHFDKDKKYPALLYCQGGPQSTVSQFWSYRWNFQMMVANDYIIVAPNRRGVPGFGKAWNEQISGDYGGQNMKDYLSAIDAVSKESFIDENRLGAIGASYGGFSVFWLAGNHNKRFKAFIAHDGMFNFESQYLETEEMWFVDWDLGGPFWDKKNKIAQRSYANSPHKFVQKWDTPILVIHSELDFRIAFTQGMSAFNAAVLRDVPAEFLYFPDENHWVLKPQNGILWQRTFFNWLDRWLK